jgi:hypothetical protein
MRRTILILGLAVLVVMAVYFAGMLPQRTERMAADARAASLQEQLDVAQAQLTASRLLGQVIRLEEVAARRDFGTAQEMSSAFFDQVRDESARTPDPAVKAALNDVQLKRDAVTAALATADASLVDLLKQVEVRLRSGLGYAVP